MILFYSGSTGNTWALPALTLKIVTYTVAISCAKNKCHQVHFLFKVAWLIPLIYICMYMYIYASEYNSWPSNKAAS